MAQNWNKLGENLAKKPSLVSVQLLLKEANIDLKSITRDDFITNMKTVPETPIKTLTLMCYNENHRTEIVSSDDVKCETNCSAQTNIFLSYFPKIWNGGDGKGTNLLGAPSRSRQIAPFCRKSRRHRLCGSKRSRRRRCRKTHLKSIA